MKVYSKLKKNLKDIEAMNHMQTEPREFGIDIIKEFDLKDKINKIQNDSINFIFEESKAYSENYKRNNNKIKEKLISDDLSIHNNIEIESYKDNYSEKYDGKVELKRMFSFEL